MTDRRLLISIGVAAASVAAGLLVLVLALALAGYDPSQALLALWRGAFGSWYALTSGTLLRAIPLITIGLGISVAFRAGALNIGAEGQFYAGAIASTAVGLRLGAWPALPALGLTISAAVLAGMIWVALPVFLKLRFGVLEVISTLLLNFVATSLVSLMVLGPLQEFRRIYPQSDQIPGSVRIPHLPGSRLHIGLLLALLLAGLLHVVFTRTVWGFHLRVTGASPEAARVSGGLNPNRVYASALFASAGFAGLAGGLEVTGVSYALLQNLSPGYGFTGIAVALLARLNPLGVILTGLLFAALEAGAGAMQRDAAIPSVSVYVVEAIIIAVVLLAERSIHTAARAGTDE